MYDFCAIEMQSMLGKISAVLVWMHAGQSFREVPLGVAACMLRMHGPPRRIGSNEKIVELACALMKSGARAKLFTRVINFGCNIT